ncbi:MAG: hypothetical protein B655_2275 [Methanobacterium sp. Maddingley MBC34]|nr:MAG: hypothetical protein B655_2275 [Methanobacterium sp. Maddingley MBC34]
MIKVEKDLYPLVEDYLIKNKFCFDEYVGNELYMGSERQMRADVFGISKENDEKIIYLLEGKHYLKGRGNFSKVLCEAIPLLEFADYVYIFGISKEEDFQSVNKKYYEICQLLGIGIILLDGNGNIDEILNPRKNSVENLDKKEIIFRIFNRKVERSPISHIIFQSAFEYIKLNELDNCAQFIEVYNALFSKEDYKDRLREVLSNKHALDETGMRKAFQNEFGNSQSVKIRRMNRILDDYICITQKGLKNVKKPVLLDNL